MKHLYLLVSFFALSPLCFAQNTFNVNGSKSNAITTAVPFLTISPDARSGALGDAGVALSPDGNSTYWNPAKLAFLEEDKSVSLSYSPWLRKIFPDVNLAYLSFTNRLDERNTFGASLRYFNLGKVDSYDDNINPLGTLRPNEFSFDVSLARKYGKNLSLGLTARFIHSGLAQGASLNGVQVQAANGFAADVSMYYNKPTSSGGSFAFGADISNIGTKMGYTNGGQQYFLPTNLRLGVANTFAIDDQDQVTLALDVNKLLVPTPPQRDANGNVTAGVDDNRSIISGIFGSFTDAPGGFSEELQEINFSPAFEYWYMKRFAVRGGFFYENPNKGNRAYATVGVGFRNTDFNFDLSYLAANQSNAPLAGVVRFSMTYNFGSFKK